MQIFTTRIWRSVFLAFLLGAALVPLAPDTGAVVAETQFSHRIDVAHHIVGELAR
jgi:hypothetical protein